MFDVFVWVVLVVVMFVGCVGVLFFLFSFILYCWIIGYWLLEIMIVII